MAKLTFTVDNLRCLSSCTPHHTSTFNASWRYTHLNRIPSRHASNLRVCCGIKEKENTAETAKVAGVLTGLRVDDELDQKGNPLSVSESNSDAGNQDKTVEFDWNWPPWKNLPMRYKLIGTTSLAFVICNMDKEEFSCYKVAFGMREWNGFRN